MKIFLIPSQKILSPFGDPAREGLILDTPLHRVMAETCAERGFSVTLGWPGPGDTPPYLIAADNLYVSPLLLKKFLKLVGDRRGLFQLALRPCLFTQELSDLQETRTISGPEGALVGYHLYYVGGTEIKPPSDITALTAKAEPLPMAIFEKAFPLDATFTKAFGDERPLVLPITGEAVFHLNHWSHLLWINFLHLYFLWISPSLGHYLRLAGKALTAFSLNPMKIMGRMNIRRGRAKIHPSAVVEGCIIEEGVEIGPLAVVRYCYLGERARIESTADVRLSIIGRGALVCQNCIVNCSVLYPGSAAGHRLIQLSVLGERAITTGGGYLIDMSYRRPVRVRFNGQTVPLKRNFLGCCIGHRAVLGTGIWINAGREIPNDVFITMPAEAIISRIPDDLPTHTPLVNVNGTLMPLNEERGTKSEERRAKSEARETKSEE
jgi:acetyltransferase-like isoleucine patch superfamily enzyme